MAKAKQRKQMRHKSGKKLRFAVIGVGGMGGGHCNSIKRVRDAKLTAVVDIVPEIAERVGTAHKVPWFTSHQDLIKADVCDAVIVATPHPEHVKPAIDCMKAKLHVISEKPLSERIGTAEKMVKAAKKNRVKFGVMFQRRFEPTLAKMLEIARSGQLGQLHRATMIDPQYRSQAYYDSGAWRATWRLEGGGVMMNQSPHSLDLFVQLTGLPVKVRGKIDTTLHKIEVEDTAEAMLTYKGGGTGYFYCSTNEPAPGQMIELFGDKGKLLYRNGELRFWKYKKPVSKFTKEVKQKWGAPPSEEVKLRIRQRKSGHFRVIENFTKHVLHGDALDVAGESGLASLELANAIMLSSWQDRELKVPISRAGYDRELGKMRKKYTGRKRVRANLQRDPHHGT